MKKKLSLLMVAFMAVAAFAGLRRAATEVTLDFTDSEVLTAMGFTLPETGKGTDITEPFTYNGITITPYASGTNVRIWNSTGSYTLRYYKANTEGVKGGIAISVPSGNKINQIVIHGNTELANTIADAGTITMSENNKDLTWTPAEGASVATVKFENNGSKTTNVETITVSYEAASETPADTWTIAGSEDILGSNWDTTDQNNDMTTTDNVNYTLVKEGLQLKAGDYKYKVVKNHSWDNENYGANGILGGDDVVLAIAEAGVYTVTFTFVNDETHALSAEATKTGEWVAPADVYTVAGKPAVLFGEEWNPALEANDMVLGENSLYSWSKTDVELTGNFEFKVCKDHGWSTAYPANNYVCEIETAGTYDVTITFNAETHAITVDALLKAAPVVFPDAAIVYDFAAAAAAGENPANKNGSAANGQAFYGWENAEKTDSKRQDYKGYEWAEGSVLPEECHVWRRSDRINGNVADGGLKCPNNKEMAVDGLDAGDKVIIVYDATNVEGDSKEMVWAIGDGSGEGGPGAPRATATIGGADAVSGTTTIASGAEILVNSVTPAENGTGYIVFQVKKGMIIKQIAVVKAGAAVEDTYTVAGAFYNGDGEQALFLETAWDAANVKNDMEKYTDTYYFKSYAGVEFPSAGNFQVKVVKNHNWDFAYPAENVTVAIAEAGKYDVSISFDTETSEVRVNVVPQFVPAEPIYTVVGAFYTAESEIDIFNGAKPWDEANTNADMIIVDGDDFYSLQIDAQGIELQPGTITYKVVKNHDWTENWGMAVTEDNPNGNAEFKINEAGKYNILFKFNPNEKFENGYHVDCVVTTTTGINNVKADDLKNATIYNLQGVRMQNVQKGLYIVNGRKVVIK